MATPPRANLSREEPDAGNLHVRVCEGWGRQRPHLLGSVVAERREGAGRRAGAASGARSPKKASLPASWSAISRVRNRRRNSLPRHPHRQEERRVGRRSSALRRARCRRPARSCGHGDGGTHAHNTLSAENTDVQVFYPFHPLHGATLQILRRPKRGDGAVCVMDPAGRRLKIPVWMLLPECAEIKISERPHLSKEALLSLASLIASQHDSKDHGHDNLLQTAVDGCEGGRRGATTTSGPDDPKGTRCRADGRSDTRRSDRSHGPHSGGGLSRGGRKS